MQTLSVISLAPNGTAAVTPFRTITADGNSSNWAFLSVGPGVIPDGQGGTLVAWYIPGGTGSNPNASYHIADVSNSGTVDRNYSAFSQPVGQMVLGDSSTGLAYASDGFSVVAFNISGGSPVWTYTPTSNTSSTNILISTTGGGLSVNDSQAGVIQLDSTGQPASPTASLLGATPLDPSTLAVNTWGANVGPWSKVANQQALVVAGPVMVPVSEWSEPAGAPQSQQAAMPISVRINFTGSKTPGDNLMFTGANGASYTCSEALGLQDCTTITGYRLWDLEGNGHVYNDASKWTVAVTNEYGYKGFYRDSSNNLQPFSCSQPLHPDALNFLQQPAGQQSIFYIDAPGPYWGINPSSQCATGTGVIDSETDTFNFQVTFTSKLSSYHRTVYYYVKIVVAPGGTTDFVNSQAGYGNLSRFF